MDDLLHDFLTETSENLAEVDVELVRLEQTPNDPDLLGSIFRLVHTIKGTCGFLGLPRLEKLAHAGENILGKFRDGELPVTPEAVTLILKSIDGIKVLLNVLEETEAEAPGNDQNLIDQLNAMADGKKIEDTAQLVEVGAADVVQTESGEGASMDISDETPKELSAETSAEENIVDPNAEDDSIFKPVLAEDTGKDVSIDPAEIQHANPSTETGEEGAESASSSEVSIKESSVANQSIRVSVDQLENLMVVASELVLTRNQLMQILRGQKDSPFAAPLQRLNHVTSELQEGVMKTRMQPIGNAWAKMPRLVRDLCIDLKKKIELQMIGADTELDRQVLELIKDPLTHMVRNSGDHGIELPADRAMAGKPETGIIKLNAYHEGGHIVIEISDDGKGLAISKIKEKILANKLASPADVESMSPQQIMQYIFKPGFSTAAKVTSVSGRGVGMDVVKTNIEKIGGTVDLQSTEGKGSRFLIKIPLTLAIVSALIVECASERFAIPQISVVELVHASENSEYKVEHINDTPVLRLRNHLLPLVSLRQALKLQDKEIKAIESTDHSKEEPIVSVKPESLEKQDLVVDSQIKVNVSQGDPRKSNPKDETSFIVVVQVGNSNFGVMVDRVFDTEEIVVKPVSPILRDIEMFSGNTILGDGSVVMILDPNGIASQAGEIQEDSNAIGTQSSQSTQIARGDMKQSLLLFTAGSGAPKAVPLSLVARLEDINIEKVEYSDGAPVVQYRGKLMPLVPIEEGKQLPETGDVPVIVFSDQERSMGLIVDEIVDIVEDRIKVNLSAQRPGFLGSAIIVGKATDVIDTGHFLSKAYQDWFGGDQETSYGDEAQNKVLLVDDSPFFRNLLSPLLTVAGYIVTTVENAEQALKLQEDGEKFDAIVSDIEMPGLNGFDFATKVREDGGSWSETPFIALSSHATPHDIERGRLAGFSDYVAKFNREALLATLQETLSSKVES